MIPWWIAFSSSRVKSARTDQTRTQVSMRIAKLFGGMPGKKSLRDSGAVLADQGLMSLGTFIVGVLVARSVSREEYGIFVLGWSLIFVIQGIQRALVVLPFTVHCPKLDASERSRYLGSGFLHTLAIGLTALLFFIAAATRPVAEQQNDSATLIQALPLISLVILPFLLREQMRSAAIAKLDFLGSAIANTCASLLMLLLAVFLYLTHTLTLSSAYLAIAATSLLSGVLLIARQWNDMSLKPGAFWPHLKYSLRIGKWILLNVAAFTLTSQIYPWLILWFFDSSAVAAYGACLALAGALNPLLRGVNAYALPRMTHGYKDGDANTLVRMLSKTVLILAVPFGLWMIVGSVFAEPLMEFFYSDKYTGYGALLSLLIFKTLIESVSAPLTSALQALERPDVTTASLVIGAAISVSLGVILVKEFGLIGAGCASVISAVSTSAWKLQFIYRTHGNR